MVKQIVLNFKIAKTEELITPNSGLTLYLELYKAVRLDKSIRALFPKPGTKGFQAKVYIVSILVLFLAGGKYLEDIRKIKLDKALRKLGKLHLIPSSDAIGQWLRNSSEVKIAAIEQLHRVLTHRFLKQLKRKNHTLDIDAFSIFSGKYSAKMTYKGETGYMPIVGHLADCDWCMGYEFRDGNVAPSDQNLTFIETCLSHLPTGHRVTELRSDSAAYQAAIFNFLDRKNIRFTITGVQNTALMAEVARIPEKNWARFKNRDGHPTDRQVAESYASMEKTDYFRIVVQRWLNPHIDIEGKEPEYCYHIICTNYATQAKSATEIIFWHNQRANSENYHKEAKGGFNLDYMPCDDTHANAVWFALGLMAYNLHIFAKYALLPQTWRAKTIASIRWQFIQIAGKVVNHAGVLWLKLAGISDDLLSTFHNARRRCAQLAFS